MSVEVELENIRGRLDTSNALLEAHTAQDMAQFTAISESVGKINAKVENLESKVDEINNKLSYNAGEKAGIKRSTFVISGIVSLAISVGAIVVKAYVG